MPGGIDVKKAYAAIEMPPSRYVVQFIIPAGLAGFAALAILWFTVPALFSGATQWLLYAIPVYLLVVAILYPYLVAEKKKHEINNNIHFFITHMGVLATTNITPVEIMEALGKKHEYGALAGDAKRIATLVSKWNMGLSEACRFVAQRTPSTIWSDFLERFAYAMDSGEDLEVFLTQEQSVLMEDFASLYNGALYEVENMKNLFSSMILSVVFVIIFAILLPIITGIDPTLLLGGAFALTLFVECLFLYFTRAKAPNDPVWIKMDDSEELKRELRRILPVSLAGCFIVTILILMFLGDLPVPIILAAGLTPLWLTGFRIAQAEERVKRRDENFPAFIRSLGASTSARGGQVQDALRTLQHHDFGALTKEVQALYARLNLQVDGKGSWAFFSKDCGSNLVDKFARMFQEGIWAGGKADEIGHILSNNFVAILTLRKSRFSSAANFRGMLMGLVFGMTFALAAGLAIVGMLKEVFSNLSIPEDSAFANFLDLSVDVNFMGLMVLGLVIGHSLTSSLMIRMVDGGNYFRAYSDFVVMTWIGSVILVAAPSALSGVL